MITKKQKEVLDYVGEYTTKKGYAPSHEEICKRFELASVSTAHHYLKKLEEGGYLKKEANHPRAISLQAFDFSISPSGMLSNMEFISIPLVGSANCGPAELLAEENVEAYIRVEKKQLPKKKGIFALRAVGKSLNRANIRGKSIDEGDIVLVDSEDKEARSGDYVLSIIDGAANLKKFRVEKGRVMLISESTEKFKPILIMPGDDWAVNGKIVGVIKNKIKL